MKLLPLANSSHVALVDDADHEQVLPFRWCWNPQRRYVYYQPPRAGKKQTTVRLHVFLIGALGGFEIDHKDGNPLNNQRENLRHATHAQNQANRRKFSCRVTTSRFKGVSSSRGKWAAFITVNRKSKNLGRFLSEDQAAAAYDRAATTTFGEFASLNFPQLTINKSKEYAL